MKRVVKILSLTVLGVLITAGKGDAGAPDAELEIVEIDEYVYAKVFIGGLPEPAEIIISFTGLYDDKTEVFVNLKAREFYRELIPLGEVYDFDRSRFVTVTIMAWDRNGESYSLVSRTWPEEAWEFEEKQWGEGFEEEW